MSALDGLFPIAGIVWCCSQNGVAPSFAQFHVGLGLTVVLVQCVWYCFRPCVESWRVLCSLLGGIVPARCMRACLYYRSVCQDGDSFALRDLRVLTVVHLWPQLFYSKAMVNCECVVEKQRMTLCDCVWCLLRPGKCTPHAVCALNLDTHLPQYVVSSETVTCYWCCLR